MVQFAWERFVNPKNAAGWFISEAWRTKVNASIADVQPPCVVVVRTIVAGACTAVLDVLTAGCGETDSDVWPPPEEHAKKAGTNASTHAFDHVGTRSYWPIPRASASADRQLWRGRGFEVGRSFRSESTTDPATDFPGEERHHHDE